MLTYGKPYIAKDGLMKLDYMGEFKGNKVNEIWTYKPVKKNCYWDMIIMIAWNLKINKHCKLWH